MAVNGIASLRYAVEDLDLCARFFIDFGLTAVLSNAESRVFLLEEGSQIELYTLASRSVLSGDIQGSGVHEVIWGVDSALNAEQMARDLSQDHEVRQDDSGIWHFEPKFGIPMGFRHFFKRPIAYAPDAVNAPGYVRRLNTHRKWRKRARPKVLSHVVFQSPVYEAASQFMRERLGFRTTDVQEGFGTYLRAGGTNDHHNILLLNANAPFPGCDGKTRFHHANFGVEDIDELMIGANHMIRQGWAASQIGLGRHRIDSALFYYLPCPTGGEAEYGADADYVDDNWVPRRFAVPLFGYSHFTHNVPPFLKVPPEWRVEYLRDEDEKT